MNEPEFDAVYKRLRAGYPRDFNQDETRGLWGSFLRHHDHTTVFATVNNWIAEHRHAPHISDVMDAVKASRRAVEPAEAEASCGYCDRGWEWVDDTTVTPCHNGCRPPRPEPHQIVDTEASPRTRDQIQSIREVLDRLKPPPGPSRNPKLPPPLVPLYAGRPIARPRSYAWREHSKLAGRDPRKSCTCEACLAAAARSLYPEGD